MRILVTGGTGFIGRHLVERLCTEGYEVRVLVRNRLKARIVEAMGAKVEFGDVTDLHSVRQAMRDVQVVFHLASRVSDWGAWHDFATATVNGTENVLNAATEAGVARFVHLSSVAVYDDRATDKSRVVPETTPRGHLGDRTHGYYARAKVMAEAAVWRYHRQYRLPVVVLRPALVYGEHDETTIPRLIDYLRSRGAMWVGRANPTIDPIHVSDVVDCALAAAVSDRAVGQAYNVAPDRELGVKDFWNLLCKELRIQAPRWTIPVWIVAMAAVLCEAVARRLGLETPPTLTRAGVAIFAKDRHHTPAKACRELGWRPKVQLTEGIRRAVRTVARPRLADRPSTRSVIYPSPQPT